MEHENGFAKALRIIGMCIIGFGMIGSFTLGSVFETGYHDYNWGVAIIGIISSIVSGTLFFGFSEVINLLDSINRKIGNANTSTYYSSNAAVLNPQPSVAKQEINVSAQSSKVNSEDELEPDENTVVFEARPTTEPIVCPKCGTSQRNNRNVCLNCGAKFLFKA